MCVGVHACTCMCACVRGGVSVCGGGACVRNCVHIKKLHSPRKCIRCWIFATRALASSALCTHVHVQANALMRMWAESPKHTHLSCSRHGRRHHSLPCSSALPSFPSSSPSYCPFLSRLQVLGCCLSTRKEPAEADRRVRVHESDSGLGSTPATEGGGRPRAEDGSCPQTGRSLARCRRPAG